VHVGLVVRDEGGGHVDARRDGAQGHA
jgi:hypothetical protein